ncbi:MAG: hypothetical protein HQL01_02530 [Nitrospirae bacterium]|nr:hypothetical protein [Nitrospirota bacterium]
MMIDKQPTKVDRRRGPDIIVKSIRWTILSCWVLLFVVWSYIYYAMPEQPSIFDPHSVYSKPRTYWDISLLKKAFISINIVLLISLVGLAVSALRHSRRTDKAPVTLILMVVLSLIGMFVIYFQF